MSEIRLQRELKVPPIEAFLALGEILSEIAAQRGAWRGFALHVGLGELHLSDVGYVAIPVSLTVGKPRSDAHAIDVSFRAVKHPESFPTFTGSVGIEATGPTGANLWLGGGYDVPLQLFGRFFDATIASGVARRTLENLIDDLAQAVVANVDKREYEYVRYQLYER